MRWLAGVVAAGGAMLAAGGIGVGLAAGMVGRNAIMGKARDEDKLQDHEKAGSRWQRTGQLQEPLPTLRDHPESV